MKMWIVASIVTASMGPSVISASAQASVLPLEQAQCRQVFNAVDSKLLLDLLKLYEIKHGDINFPPDDGNALQINGQKIQTHVGSLSVAFSQIGYRCGQNPGALFENVVSEALRAVGAVVNK